MFKIIFFVLLFGLISNAKNHAVIGDYPTVNMKTCGLSKIKETVTTRIVNGDNASLGEFPWMAAIITKDEGFNCGGAIISSYWILTAANCFYQRNLTKEKITVFIGSLNKTSGKDFEVKNIFIQEEYNQINKKVNDIALIELTSEIKPEMKQENSESFYVINGLCLPKEEILNSESEYALFSGWGNIETNKQIFNLRKAKYKILSYESGNSPKQIASYEENHTICFGDTGSPLIQLVGDRAVIIGIQSRVSRSSTSRCEPSYQYFTRVSFFIFWILTKINKNIKPNTKNPDPIDNNKELSPIIILGSIFAAICFVAIVFMIIVAVIIRRHKTKTRESQRILLSMSGSLRSRESSTIVSEASVETVHSQTGQILSDKKVQIEDHYKRFRK